MKLKGIKASEGIAIGKLFKFIDQKLEIKNTRCQDKIKEIKILNEAVIKTKKDILESKKIAKKNFGSENSQIFDAHLSILNDPEFLNNINFEINTNSLSAPSAIQFVSDKWIKTFENIDDPYFKARSNDVFDVSKRLLSNLLGVRNYNLDLITQKSIIFAYNLTPSETAKINPKLVNGFVCELGSRTSHVAIMARSLEIPSVLGIKQIFSKILKFNQDDTVIVDGYKGEIIIDPDDETLNFYKKEIIKKEKEKKELQKYLNKLTFSEDNKRIVVEANIGCLKDVDKAIENGAEGIGLFRTEFLYMGQDNFPSEEKQFQVYKSVLEKMKNKLVVIRTLDIGGDKYLKYFKFPKELNPFLGYRAIRLCLDRVDIFNTQIRALLRASKYGKLAIMFPMIATIDEFKKAKNLVLEQMKKLKQENFAISDDIQIGMMVEIPSAALNINNFAKYADFFSIGTNDLNQYSFAADRMSKYVSYLYQPLNPAFIKMLKIAIDGAHKHNKWIAMCGEAASSLEALPVWLGLNLDALSMSSSSILKIKKEIFSLNIKKLNKIINELINLETNTQVLNYLKEKNIIK